MSEDQQPQTESIITVNKKALDNITCALEDLDTHNMLEIVISGRGDQALLHVEYTACGYDEERGTYVINLHLCEGFRVVPRIFDPETARLTGALRRLSQRCARWSLFACPRSTGVDSVSMSTRRRR